jgi:MoxR-like ATPase
MPQFSDKYTGKKHPKPGERDKNGQLLYPYLPSNELIEAVNLAIYLNRPLLLKGEPGCGKTELARAVAYELGLDYKAWCIKSSSRARDGLYTYDAVRRLLDAQLAGAGKLSKDEAIKRFDRDPHTYVRWGSLGEAFRSDRQTVVLIDEIDKADLDFPNDLLTELDQRWFIVEETQERVEAKEPPIVFITSNDEKELPNAFLRRCLFHYVKFPDRERLVQILENRFSTLEELPPLRNKVVDNFLDLRERMKKLNLSKIASTSELIDWVNVILANHNHNSDEALKRLEKEYLPYPSVLLKHWDNNLDNLIKL